MLHDKNNRADDPELTRRGKTLGKKRATRQRRTAWLYVNAIRDEFPHNRRQSRGMV